MYSIAHIREYLREFETEFEIILGYYLGPRDNWIMKKKPGVENLVREAVSLICIIRIF
jgi:hypothetical protein